MSNRHLIITRYDSQTLSQKSFGMALLLTMWGLFLYIMYPLLLIVGWLLAGYLFHAAIGPTAGLNSLAQYILARYGIIVLAIWCTFSLWVGYNILCFRGAGNKRVRDVPRLTSVDYAEMTGLDVGLISLAQQSKLVVAYFDAMGNLCHFDCFQNRPEGEVRTPLAGSVFPALDIAAKTETLVEDVPLADIEGAYWYDEPMPVYASAVVEQMAAKAGADRPFGLDGKPAMIHSESRPVPDRAPLPVEQDGGVFPVEGVGLAAIGIPQTSVTGSAAGKPEHVFWAVDDHMAVPWAVNAAAAIDLPADTPATHDAPLGEHEVSSAGESVVHKQWQSASYADQSATNPLTILPPATPSVIAPVRSVTSPVRVMPQVDVPLVTPVGSFVAPAPSPEWPAVKHDASGDTAYSYTRIPVVDAKQKPFENISTSAHFVSFASVLSTMRRALADNTLDSMITNSMDESIRVLRNASNAGSSEPQAENTFMQTAETLHGRVRKVIGPRMRHRKVLPSPG